MSRQFIKPFVGGGVDFKSNLGTKVLVFRTHVEELGIYSYIHVMVNHIQHVKYTSQYLIRNILLVAEVERDI